MVILTEQDVFDRYHDEKSYSFGGKRHLKDKIRINDKDLDNILSQSNIYTEFRQFRKPNLLPPIRTYEENYLWEADLMFFTHPDFASTNDGYLYILVIIDTFTKMVNLKLLKNKSTSIVTASIEQLLLVHKPKYLLRPCL